MTRAAILVALAGILTAAVNLPVGQHPAAIQPAAAEEPSAGTRCEIRVYKHGGQTMVEGVVYAREPLSGAYRLSVNGPSDNDQSGSFRATPNGATSLGQIAVAPGSYAAHMTVRWHGGETMCAQHAE